MKIQQALAFRPRRTATPPDEISLHTSDSTLREENPLFLRGVELGYGAVELASAARGATPWVRGAEAGLGVFSAVWGVNKLVAGESWLDRVEGVGSLALAGQSGLLAAGAALPGLELGLAVAFAASEGLIGGLDAHRGLVEQSPHRTVAGAMQATVALSSLVGQLVPALAAPALGVMAAALVTRQAAIAHSPH